MAAIKRLLTVILVGGCLSWFPCRAVAQPPADAWTTRLAGRITLDSLTHFLNLHSRYRITYDSRKIDGNLPIPFPTQQYTIIAILNRIRSAGRLDSRFFGVHIILSKIKAATAAAAPTPVSPRAHPLPTSLANLIPRDTLPRQIQALRPRVRPRPIAIAAVPTPATTDPRIAKSPKDHPFLQHLQLGVSGNEVFYGNLLGEAGWPFLHALAGASAGQRGVTCSAGLGSVIAGDDDQEIQLRLLFSPLHATVETIDTFQQADLVIKGDQFRAEALWCKPVSARWILKIGAALSMLKTGYYHHGVLTDPGSFSTHYEVPDNLVYLVKPPLKFYNNYSSASPQNYKLWPGLTVSICYSFGSAHAGK